MPETLVTDVQERAQSALSASPIYLLRHVQVERIGDSLFLSGRVDSFYYKQLAQEVVRSVSEGVQVINTIDVQ